MARSASFSFQASSGETSTTRGSGAPRRTQSTRWASSSAGMAPSGGIWSSGFVWLIASMRSDSSGAPGTIAGPWSPPRTQPLRESRARPPLISWSWEWQAKQRASSTGRTVSVKNCSSETGAAGSSAARMGTLTRRHSASAKAARIRQACGVRVPITLPRGAARRAWRNRSPTSPRASRSSSSRSGRRVPPCQDSSCRRRWAA